MKLTDAIDKMGSSDGGNRPNDLNERLTVFTARVVVSVDRMPKTMAGQYYAGHLLRSGGSPALHYGEAQGAESASDFIHKCKIALKELKESLVNLRIQALSKLMSPEGLDLIWLADECDQLIRIVGKIISNSQRSTK